MYVQSAFRENDLATLYDVMHQTHLATLVTSGADGLGASHVPVIVDTAKGPKGTLIGHLSRANLQW